MGLSGRMATGDLLAACRLRQEWQSESRTPRDRLEGAGVSEDKAIWGQPWQCIQGWGHQEEEAKEQTGQTAVGHPRTDAEVTRGGGEPEAWH